MYTYPKAFSAVTVAEALAFIKSPNLLARRFAEIVAAQKFLSPLVLSGRYDMVGGALAYLPDEAIAAGSAPEQIKPGGNYPLISLNADEVRIIEALKKGFGTEVTDEAVGRFKMDPIERALQMLANRMVSDFDSVAMSLVASAITATVSGAAWSTATNIVANVAAAKAALANKKLGYNADAVILTETQWASVQAPLLSLLPRESANPIVSGGFPNIMGVTWLHSPNLPGGWVPTVVDSANLGGIGHEDIPSEGYVSVAVGDGTSVEVARFREKNDSTLVQVRKADVPVVRNAGAGVEITGTGL